MIPRAGRSRLIDAPMYLEDRKIVNLEVLQNFGRIAPGYERIGAQHLYLVRYADREERHGTRRSSHKHDDEHGPAASARVGVSRTSCNRQE
jgi:hypothetical protein